MSDKIDKRITCIIEDYKAIKGEISRRSDLQRFALLAYGGVIVLSLKFNEEANFSELQIILIWLSSSIVFLYYLLEDDFIKRLNKIANFNGWLFNCLLEWEENQKSNNVKLSDTNIELLFVNHKDYLDRLNKDKEYYLILTTPLKNVTFPSESAIIGRIIGTNQYNPCNKKAELFSLFFLLSYLIILPLAITTYYKYGNLKCFFILWKDICTLPDNLIIVPICLVLNLCLSVFILVPSFFSKSSKFS